MYDQLTNNKITPQDVIKELALLKSNNGTQITPSVLFTVRDRYDIDKRAKLPVLKGIVLHTAPSVS